MHFVSQTILIRKIYERSYYIEGTVSETEYCFILVEATASHQTHITQKTREIRGFQGFPDLYGGGGGINRDLDFANFAGHEKRLPLLAPVCLFFPFNSKNKHTEGKKMILVSNPLAGHVYVAKSKSESIYKIGKTKNEVKNRLVGLRAKHGAVDILFTFKTNDIEALEKSLQKTFESVRLPTYQRSKEWFLLTQEHLDILQALPSYLEIQRDQFIEAKEKTKTVAIRADFHSKIKKFCSDFDTNMNEVLERAFLEYMFRVSPRYSRNFPA